MEIAEQVSHWRALFAKNGICCDVDAVKIPENSDMSRRLVIVPDAEPKHICAVFKNVLRYEFDIAPFIPPAITEEPGTGKLITVQFSDLVPHNVRTNAAGAYAYWVRPHVSIAHEELLHAGTWDASMTVTEAFLYHLYWLETYGEEYLELHYSTWQPCEGSRNGSRVPKLQWDLQDGKVVLRL